ncbi:Uncharacterised protein [Salmonella enterica subsp. enterica serovar Madelia]|nr:Uncharacterised protein [Salmonella enterica subsp. enterica serovar Madelia]
MVSSSAASTIERQATGAGFTRHCFPGDSVQRFVTEFQIDAFQVKQRLILLGQRIFRLFQDLNQRFFAEFVQRRHHWQTTDNSGIRPNLIKSSGSTCDNSSPSLALSDFAFTVAPKTNAGAGFNTVSDHFIQTGKRAAADKQNLRGIYL